METRGERIAGEDKKITQADIEKLEKLDPNGDLKIAREILPADFFKQLEAGKWFGIGKGSVLEKQGYIEKLNAVSQSYDQEKHEVIEDSQEALQSVAFRGEWKYEGVLSVGNKKRKDEIYNLQVALHLSGETSVLPDGVWGFETRRSMQRLVSQMPNRDEGYESGTMMNQPIFDFLYKKVYGVRPSEAISSKNYSQTSQKTDLLQDREIPQEPEKQAEVVIFTRTLRLTSPRMQGPDVQLLQQKLTEAGYNLRDTTGKFDGIFGPQTAQALKTYQQQKLGQKGDGVMDLGGKTQQSFELQVDPPTKKTETQTGKSQELLEMKTEIKTPEIPQARTLVSENMKTALTEVGIQDPKVQRKIEASLVNVGIGWGKGGTGAFIGPNLILTAEHVLRDLDTGDMKRIGKIKGADGKTYQIEKIFIDSSNNDIAYIQTKEASADYLEYAPDSRKARTEGILLGFSGSRPRFYAPAVTPETQETEALYNKRDRLRYGETMFVDYPAQKGDSGGPIVDKTGKILGIIIRSYEYGDEGEAGSIAEPIDDIAKFSKTIIS